MKYARWTRNGYWHILNEHGVTLCQRTPRSTTVKYADESHNIKPNMVCINCRRKQEKSDGKNEITQRQQAKKRAKQQAAAIARLETWTNATKEWRE